MSFRLLPFFLISAVVCHAAETRPTKPNIIIMMADDMGLGDTSAYLGVRLSPESAPISKTLHTPNIEAFARQAIVFTDAHAPASMCSSTRYSLLTGRFAHRAYLKKQGWLPHGPNTPMIQQAMPTLPKMLQKNGYTTAGIAPLTHSDVSIIRSLMVRGGDLSSSEPIPAFLDLHPSFYAHRLPVGPTLRFHGDGR